MKVSNRTKWKAELDWADIDLRNSRVGKADSLNIRSHPNLPEPVMKGWNDDIKVNDHERLKSLKLKLMNKTTVVRINQEST